MKTTTEIPVLGYIARFSFAVTLAQRKQRDTGFPAGSSSSCQTVQEPKLSKKDGSLPKIGDGQDAMSFDFSSSSGSWFALQVKARSEATVARILEVKGYEAFYPTSPSAKPSHRIRSGTPAALFPGYVFCRLDASIHSPMLTTQGVIRILGVGPEPQPVPIEEVESIRLASSSGLTLDHHPFGEVGSRVVILRGPLAGTRGILTRSSGACRLVISVTLLQRSVAVELDQAWVECEPAGRTMEQRHGLAFHAVTPIGFPNRHRVDESHPEEGVMFAASKTNKETLVRKLPRPQAGGTHFSRVLEFATDKRLQFRNITDELRAAVAQSRIKTGLVHVQSLHTTLGVFVGEWQDALLHDVEAVSQ